MQISSPARRVSLLLLRESGQLSTTFSVKSGTVIAESVDGRPHELEHLIVYPILSEARRSAVVFHPQTSLLYRLPPGSTLVSASSTTGKHDYRAICFSSSRFSPENSYHSRTPWAAPRQLQPSLYLEAAMNHRVPGHDASCTLNLKNLDENGWVIARHFNTNGSLIASFGSMDDPTGLIGFSFKPQPPILHSLSPRAIETLCLGEVLSLSRDHRTGARKVLAEGLLHRLLGFGDDADPAIRMTSGTSWDAGGIRMVTDHKPTIHLPSNGIHLSTVSTPDDHPALHSQTNHLAGPTQRRRMVDVIWRCFGDAATSPLSTSWTKCPGYRMDDMDSSHDAEELLPLG
ncbi:hypothetical protein C8R42DRAFT_727767 [Lentinula raphanica]|nr:hypothetical protein C8R42DRAFT_727767 [Lentinula raphanica]